MNALSEMLTERELDGVWMDYLHWHAQFEDPYPLFIKTCFNDCCLEAFQTWANVEIQGNDVSEKAKWIFMKDANQWEDWRVLVMLDWAKEFRYVVNKIRPDAHVIKSGHSISKPHQKAPAR